VSDTPDGAEIERLLALVPRWIVSQIPSADALEEIVADLGRPPCARFRGGTAHVALAGEISHEDLQYVLGRVTRFRDDNRTGIERTLHRVACIRDRYHEIVGFTFRVGRTVPGAARPIADLLGSGRSVLVIGRPGVGKTTLLRSAADLLSGEMGRRTVIADTSNEIGGDGQIPHPAIGRARRLQIPLPDTVRPSVVEDLQAQILLQAVVNHGAEAIVVDEIGFEAEARMVRTVAQRGVQLVATAHGHRLRDVVFNPDLACLVGSPRPVVLSTEETARLGATRHTALERTEPPTFESVVEVSRRDLLVVHADVAASVDLILAGLTPRVELRRPEGPGAPSRECDGAVQ